MSTLIMYIIRLTEIIVYLGIVSLVYILNVLLEGEGGGEKK